MAKKKAGLRCDDKGRFSTYSQAGEEAASYTAVMRRLRDMDRPAVSMLREFTETA